MRLSLILLAAILPAMPAFAEQIACDDLMLRSGRHPIAVSLLNTVGVGSDSNSIQEQMVRNGTSAFRVNGSFLRQNRFVTGVLLDLPGPKMRVSLESVIERFHASGEIEISPGDKLLLVDETTTTTSVEGFKLIPVPKEALVMIAESAKVGGEVKFNDGKIINSVTKISKNSVELAYQGRTQKTLTEKKGINVPNVHFRRSSLLKADKTIMRHALFTGGVSHIAVSFVNRAKDIIRAKAYIEELYKEWKNDLAALRSLPENSKQFQKLMRKYQSYLNSIEVAKKGTVVAHIESLLATQKPLIVAKIETTQGFENAEEIVKHADIIMYARGDYGAEVKPHFWKSHGLDLKHLCRQYGKGYISATGKLEVAQDSETPARVEITDVSADFDDGADGEMTSAETGYAPKDEERAREPAEIVELMYDINMESEVSRSKGHTAYQPVATAAPIDGLTFSDSSLKKNMVSRFVPKLKGNVDFLVVRGDSQQHVMDLYRKPPGQRVIFVTSDESLAKQTSLIHGVNAVAVDENTSNAEIAELMSKRYKMEVPQGFSVHDIR